MSTPAPASATITLRPYPPESHSWTLDAITGPISGTSASSSSDAFATAPIE